MQVEDHVAVFHQNSTVALTAVNRISRRFPEDGLQRCGHAGDGGGVSRCGRRIFESNRMEGDFVAGPDLPDLPEFRLQDRGRAHEAAEARAVGTKDDRHVACEIDRADLVGVVVDVGGMEACLAAVRTRPCRLGSDEADARARRVVVNLPGGRKYLRDVVVSKKIGGPVRAVGDSDRPVV